LVVPWIGEKKSVSEGINKSIKKKRAPGKGRGLSEKSLRKKKGNGLQLAESWKGGLTEKTGEKGRYPPYNVSKGGG